MRIKKTSVNVRLDPALLTHAKGVAKQLGISFTALVEIAIERYAGVPLPPQRSLPDLAPRDPATDR